MHLQSKNFSRFAGGGDDNGSTVSVTMGGFPPSEWIVATPYLQFINSHRSESFAFAGVEGYILVDPQTHHVTEVNQPSNDPSSWGYSAWSGNLAQVTFSLRLRNAYASGVAIVEFWGEQ